MQKAQYPTWYEFKEDLQKEVGHSILNQEWLCLKPEAPLPWNDSCFHAVLLKLIEPRKRFRLTCSRQLEQRLSHSDATHSKNGSSLVHV